MKSILFDPWQEKLIIFFLSFFCFAIFWQIYVVENLFAFFFFFFFFFGRLMFVSEKKGNIS